MVTPAPTPTPARAVAYLCAPPPDAGHHALSIERQRLVVTVYALHHGLDLVAEFEDAAPHRHRPGLREVLSFLEEGAASVLVVPGLSHLGQTLPAVGEVVGHCSRMGWGVLSVAEDLDTRTATGRLVVGLLGRIAQHEHDAIEEQAAALAASRIPYGFRLAEDGERLEEHPEEQEVSRLAREACAAGLPLADLAAQLTARGLTPRDGCRWA